MSALKRTPTSIAEGSPASTWAGVTFGPAIVHGQEMGTLTLAAAPILALSSTARALIVAVGAPWAFQLYDHELVPVAGCQLAPSSVETSTPATVPPPASVEDPEIVTSEPSAIALPAAGLAIVVVGAVVSVEADSGTRPDISVVG